MHLYSPHHGPKYHMFTDVGLGNWVMPLDEHSPEALFEPIQDIVNRQHEAQQRVREAMSRIDEMFSAACQTIRNCLR